MMPDVPELPDVVDLSVQVVYALPEEQFICDLRVPSGTTVQEALTLSGFQQRFAALGEEPLECAVFGVLAAPEQVLQPGDRVEILRPLLADPKVRRRQSVVQARQAQRRQRSGSEG